MSPSDMYLLWHGLIHRLWSLQGSACSDMEHLLLIPTVVLLLSLSGVFCPFLKQVFTEAPPSWLTGSAVPCGWFVEAG